MPFKQAVPAGEQLSGRGSESGIPGKAVENAALQQNVLALHVAVRDAGAQTSGRTQY
jgi:hypothetical protein